MTPRISIIICTRNRADSLRQTLDAIGKLAVPQDLPTELLVVDNGSTDDTAEVAQQASVTNLSAQYICEPRSGKGYAYNAGIAAAAGEVLLFTDDDVRPPANWIEKMARPILDGQCDALAGGVTIAPHLHRPWMEPFHRDCLAGTEWMQNAPQPLMVGANMAFARRVTAKVPGFDPELGPGALGFSDETLFSRQLLEAGYKINKALDIAVEHHIEPSRLSRASFLSTAEKYGKSAAYVSHHWEHANVDRPGSRAMRASLRLAFFRAKRSSECKAAEGIAAWEFGMVRDVAFYDQLKIEQQRPRNYARHGLKKLEVAGKQ